jgi:hypothetical protein
MNYRGDFGAGQVVRFLFSTYSNTNAPITLAGSPVASVYRDNGVAEATAGVTLTVDFDAKTGLHLIEVNTASDTAFYAVGSDFAVVFTAGTVDAVSIVGTVVGSFSLANRSFSRATPEQVGVPAANSTPQSRIAWLFKLSRNKTNVTPSGIAVRNDADTADDSTAAHAEGASTYTRNKFA